MAYTVHSSLVEQGYIDPLVCKDSPSYTSNGHIYSKNCYLEHVYGTK